MADARHVQFARELEARDERVAGALAPLRQLEADVAEVRTHAAAIAEFRAGYPGERERLDHALSAAAAEVEKRRAEREQAETDLARAKKEEDVAAARRAVTRARDTEASARRKLERAEEESSALERDAERAAAEEPRLRARAGELAKRLDAAPRVTHVDTDPADLRSLLEWTSRARAALFVAAGGLETERERIVREANELAAAALGPDAAATSVAVVRERIERAAEA